jgi:hypothetical protein
VRPALVLAALLTAAAASAQPAPPGRLTYGTAAVGVGLTGWDPPAPTLAFSAAADLHATHGRLHLQGGGSTQVGQDGATVEIHVLAGTARTRGPLVVSAAVGPSFAYVVRSQDTRPAGPAADEPGGIAPGLYASLGASVVVFPEVAFGVEAFGLLNARIPVAGLRLTTSLGRLPRSAVR